MSLPDNYLYEFGDCRLDPREKLLVRGDKRTLLTPKIFEMLILFLEKKGKLITKDELMERVWADSFVEESNLTFTIRQLRKALGDDAHVPKFIETVPRRGYRFITRVKGTVRAVSEPIALSDTESLNSIAVLPFVNMSADAENEYFCDGLAEELLNELAKIDKLKVAARTSSFSFKNKNINISKIGKALNVKTVLEGSVRRSHNQLRITTQLINVSDGFNLWSERYDREMQDIFDVQDQITFAIVDILKVNVLGKPKSDLLRRSSNNLAAYELYLKGLYYFNKHAPQHWLKAIDYFEQAIASDPNHASTYVWKGFCYAALWYYGYLPPEETVPHWKTCAKKALQIDGDMAEAHLSNAGLLYFYDWNWIEAEREYRRALVLSPNSADVGWRYGLLLTTLNRFDEAIVQGKKSLELDPLSLMVNLYLGFIYLGSEYFAETFEQVSKMLKIEPNFYGAHHLLGRTYLATGEYEEAILAFQKSLALGGGQIDLSGLGAANGLAGKRDEALMIANQLIKTKETECVPAINIARIYFGLGENDLAIEWLEQSIAERNCELVFLHIWMKLVKGDKRGAAIRSDKRFIKLVKQIGLPIEDDYAKELPVVDQFAIST